ncbi:MAG: hypothetical protein HYZ17_12925 [Betaproteobacteria bacterium]|nr:hypothetical protein [Betaproteobacteria bacterium]
MNADLATPPEFVPPGGAWQAKRLVAAQTWHRLACLGPLLRGMLSRAALLCGLALGGLPAGLAWASDAFELFAISTPHAYPTRIAIDKSNVVWFIQSNFHRIGSFHAGKNAFAEYAPPTPKSFPSDLAVGADGRIWTVESNANQLGVLNPASGSWQEYDIPTIESLPSRIAVDPQGRVWFTQFYGNKVGMFDPRRETFKEFPIRTPASRPSGIVVDRKGTVWFLETQGNKLVKLNPGDGAMREFELPQAFESPREIALSNSGMLWFGGHIGRNLMSFNPATAKFSSFALPRGGVIESLAAAGDGKIYFTLRTSSKIGVFDPATRAFLEIDAAPGKGRPGGIGIDAKGNIWFADTEKNTLSRLDAGMVAKLWQK